MYRGPFRAAVALLQLLVFLGVQFAEGTGVHRCPEHDAGVGVAPAGEHAMHHMAAMEGHAGHGGAPDQQAHTCHCMGACATATVAMPSAAAPLLARATIGFLPPAAQSVVSHRDTLRRLPFAIGPPLLA
ncbi:MAG: hypothetical protein U0133_11305 [Gemmatimonadales bacterium]